MTGVVVGFVVTGVVVDCVFVVEGVQGVVTALVVAADVVNLIVVVEGAK